MLSDNKKKLLKECLEVFDGGRPDRSAAGNTIEYLYSWEHDIAPGPFDLEASDVIDWARTMVAVSM